LKVSAKEVLTKFELQKYHLQLDIHLSKHLPEIYKGDILNGATINGNKTIVELKHDTAIKKQQELELNVVKLEKKNQELEKKNQSLREIKSIDTKPLSLPLGWKLVRADEFDKLIQQKSAFDRKLMEVERELKKVKGELVKANEYREAAHGWKPDKVSNTVLAAIEKEEDPDGFKKLMRMLENPLNLSFTEEEARKREQNQRKRAEKLEEIQEVQADNIRIKSLNIPIKSLKENTEEWKSSGRPKLYLEADFSIIYEVRKDIESIKDDLTGKQAFTYDATEKKWYTYCKIALEKAIEIINGVLKKLKKPLIVQPTITQEEKLAALDKINAQVKQKETERQKKAELEKGISAPKIMKSQSSTSVASKTPEPKIEPLREREQDNDDFEM